MNEFRAIRRRWTPTRRKTDEWDFDDEQRDHVHGFWLDGFFGTIRRPSRRQEWVAHDSPHEMLGE